MSKTEGLLIVKEKPEQYVQMCADYGIATLSEIKTIKDIKKECKGGKGNLVKKYLNRFDLILVDDRLALHTVAKELGG